MNSYVAVMARLETATEPSKDLDADIMVLTADIGLYYRGGEWWYDSSVGQVKVVVPSYTDSIDEALRLLPLSTEYRKIGATVWINPNGRGEARIWRRIKDDQAEGGWAIGVVPGDSGLPANMGATPAIALCIAALKARRSEFERDGREC